VRSRADAARIERASFTSPWTERLAGQVLASGALRALAQRHAAHDAAAGDAPPGAAGRRRAPPPDVALSLEEAVKELTGAEAAVRAALAGAAAAQQAAVWALQWRAPSPAAGSLNHSSETLCSQPAARRAASSSPCSIPEAGASAAAPPEHVASLLMAAARLAHAARRARAPEPEASPAPPRASRGAPG